MEGVLVNETLGLVVGVDVRLHDLLPLTEAAVSTTVKVRETDDDAEVLGEGVTLALQLDPVPVTVGVRDTEVVMLGVPVRDDVPLRVCEMDTVCETEHVADTVGETLTLCEERLPLPPVPVFVGLWVWDPVRVAVWLIT